MEKQIITFSANEQRLIKTGGIECYASNIVSYIEAHFDLGANWNGYDSVRAVWSNDNNMTVISTVLDSNGVCVVPFEVLKTKGIVKVNLVGSISVSDVLTDRLTSFPCEAVKVTAKAKIEGSETAPITPSQFEQFVAAVKTDADRAEQGASDAETYANNAETSADNALLYSQNAEGSAIRASGYALDAQGYAQNAENYASDAEDARDEIRNMSANATTLPSGSDATASYSDGVLSLGIPQGIQGEKGDNGDTGATPNLTIGTVETLDPSESATATITGTDENPVLNLGLPKGEQGEVSLDELSALLPTDTASGAIASFPDGTDLFPALSVKAEIEPIQDLHGYDKPWAGGAGRNLLNVGGRVNQTTAEVRYTSDDNYIILNGTKNGGGYATMGNLTLTLPAGTYYAKAFIISGTTTNEISLYVNNGTSDITGTLLGTEKSFTLESETTLRFRFAVWNDGTVLTNYTVGIVVSKTSGIDKFYPYSNICPISGHTECVTSVSGVNVWDEEWEVGGYNATNGEKVTGTSRIRSKNKIPCVPNTTYFFGSVGAYTAWVGIYYYDANENYLSAQAPNVNHTFTTPSDAHFMTFNTSDGYGTTYNNDISINYPSTDTDYHAYNGHTYTTTLGRTVYGGTLDVVSGELVVDRVVDTMSITSMYAPTSGGNYNPNFDFAVFSASEPWLNNTQALMRMFTSDGSYFPNVYFANVSFEGAILVYSSGSKQFCVSIAKDSTLAEAQARFNGVQLCYELATPQTYQLDPTEVDLLLGQNNVWTDCGSVEVTYKADIQRWVLKKLSE